MGVNISGKGVLSGLATLVAGVVNNLNLLVTRVIGYTNTGGGGSSYYTTTVTTQFSAPIYMTVSNSAYLFAYSTDFAEWTEGPLPSPGSFGQYNSIVYAEDKFLALSGNGKIAYSTSINSNSWTLVSLPQAGIAWTNISYGNGKFVALTYYLGGAAYSEDGITWTLTTVPSEPDWSDLTYGDGKFVAVANSLNFQMSPSNKAMYSTDGITWTETTLPASKLWTSVTYGNGRFVASSNDLIAYSTNGISWTTATTSGVGGNTGIAYGSGKFIAVNVGYSPEQNANFVNVYQSTDGDIWTSVSVAPYTFISSISYVNDRFIANIGQYMGQMTQLYSTDGITWTNFSLSPSSSTSWLEGVYGQGTISTQTEVQVSIGDQGSGGAEILAPVDIYTVPALKTTSIDEVRVKNTSGNSITYDLGVLNSGVQLSDQNALINDQTISAGATATVTSISSPLTAGQRIVVFPSAVDVVEVKVYGTEISPPPPAAEELAKITNADINTLPFDTANNKGAVEAEILVLANALVTPGYAVTIQPGSTYVANQWSGSLTVTNYYYPNDTITDATNRTLTIVITEPPIVSFIALPYEDNRSMYSTDGITWATRSLPAVRRWSKFLSANGANIALAVQSDKAAYSADGLTWIETTMPSTQEWYTAAYGNGKFVALGSPDGVAAYSTDGITWTASTLPQSGYWASISYGNGKFVATKINSSVAAYSVDGITWTETVLPSTAYWSPSAYGNGKFVTTAVLSNKAAYSTDGINWIATTMPYSSDWSRVTYGNGRFIAIGQAALAEDGETIVNSAYSTDGINWTAMTMPFGNNWGVVGYGNNKFIVLTSGISSNYGIYSEDGITWSVTNNIPNIIFTSVGPVL